MKVLLTGATGLLGYSVVNHLVKMGFEVIATYHRSRSLLDLNHVTWIEVNLENGQKTVELVRSTKPDVIIHAAAYTDVDGCESDKDKAFRINYQATKAIAQIASKTKTYLVYVSTDYVFDGEKGMYKENDIPYPVNYYGLTKLLGEIVVQSLLPSSSLIIRTSGLYGYSPTGKKNFGIVALEKLLRKEEVLAFKDQYLSPTYTYYFAKELIKIVEEGVTGLLHLAGERLSRYEFAVTLARTIGVSNSLVKPVSLNDVRLVAKRPRDSSLDVSKAKSMGFSLPPVTDCVTHFIENYRKLHGTSNAL
ncbi:MAG: dTDP-4-dehydrorhamnose reductase [Desulfurococcaceae archaeon]